MEGMPIGRWAAFAFWTFASCLPLLRGQVIEFESGGLKYLTQTKSGVTVMFAPLPLQIREYAVIQVAISNGSPLSWTFRPEDFRLVRQADPEPLVGIPAGRVVAEFLHRGGREDVIKLVTAYENGLYGMVRVKSTNGYEARLESAMAALTNARFRAAAAASAIVLAPIKLKPGESTDGAVFFATSGKPLDGKLVVQVAGILFEFPTPAPRVQSKKQ